MSNYQGTATLSTPTDAAREKVIIIRREEDTKLHPARSLQSDVKSASRKYSCIRRPTTQLSTCPWLGQTPSLTKSTESWAAWVIRLVYLDRNCLGLALCQFGPVIVPIMSSWQRYGSVGMGVYFAMRRQKWRVNNLFNLIPIWAWVIVVPDL